MNKLKNFVWKGIGYGILVMWIMAIVNRYIHSDGWMLYPATASGCFLIIILGIWIATDGAKIYYCKRCRNYFHEGDSASHRTGDRHSSYPYTCNSCFVANKLEENKDDGD